MNLKDKLNRFNSHLTPSKKSSRTLPQIASRYAKLCDAMEGEIITNFAGSYCLVKRIYPFHHLHGSKTLAITDKEISLDAFSLIDSEKKIPFDTLLFFDIETTGLGGSGAVPFLVGFANITNAGFEIRQYLLVDYPDETAMLEDILSEISDGKSLVSYNGTTFDLPFMKERMILNRVAKEFKTDIHIDLLYATRRFFKRRLGNCKLTNIEQEIFEFYRNDDIPGYLVPSVYFEWLNSESVEMMDDVLEHNRLDILSLYFLLLEINDLYQSKGFSCNDVDDLHSLSKTFYKKKDYKSSHEVSSYIKEIAKSSLATDILYFQSMQSKKTKHIQEAAEIWEYLTTINCQESYSAHIELAKYYEHKIKDIKKAYSYSQKAQKFSEITDFHKSALQKRLARLERKIK